MTFCIAINQEIAVSTCPLPKGQCYWQHRQTLNCKYTNEELSEAEFCQRVGALEVTEAERTTLMDKIKNTLRG